MIRARLPQALLPLLVLAGCGPGGRAETDPGETETPVNVRTLRVEPGELRETVTVSGPLRPLRGADVSAQEGGVVESIPRDKGARVTAGEPFVLLERDVLDADKRAVEAARDLAEYTETRSRQLFEANQLSAQEMLRIEAERAQAEARADVARLRWERAAVKAPFGGIISDVAVEIGELVAPGTRVGRVVDPYTLTLEGAVSEREVGSLRVDAPAVISLDGEVARAEGHVAWVSLEAQPATGKFPLEVHIDNRDLALRPGVVARADVLVATHRDVIVIPRDALVLKPDGPVAYVVGPDDRAVERRLTIGPDQGLMTVVLEGLAAGDRLIVRGQREVHDGSVVRVREEADSPDGSVTAGSAS